MKEEQIKKYQAELITIIPPERLKQYEQIIDLYNGNRIMTTIFDMLEDNFEFALIKQEMLDWIEKREAEESESEKDPAISDEEVVGDDDDSN